MTWTESGDDRAWDAATHLAAVGADHLAAANWQRGGKGQRPKPLPRPAELRRSASAQANNAERARRFLQRQRERGAE